MGAAIDVSPDGQVLFTATIRRLYREEITASGTLQNEQVWELPLSQPDERITDVSAGGDGTDVIAVITNLRLLILSYDAGSDLFTLEKELDKYYVEPGTPGDLSDDYGFFDLDRVVVHQSPAAPDGDGQWRAYVLGTMIDWDFNSAVSAGGEKHPSGLMVCDLEFPATAGAPYDGAGWVGTAIWNPMDNDAQDGTPQDPLFPENLGSAFVDVVLVNEGASILAVCASGLERQVCILDVTSHDAPGFSVHKQLIADPATPSEYPMLHVQLDPLDSTRVFAVSMFEAYHYDRSTGPNGTLLGSALTKSYGRWGESKLAAIRKGGEAFAWNAAGPGDAVDRYMRVLKFDPVQGVSQVATPYGLGTSDGAVAIIDLEDLENSFLYVPTYGGLVAYEATAPGRAADFTVVPSSYQPAVDQFGIQHSTEHVIEAYLGPHAGEGHRILTTFSTGGYLEWELDANMHPMPPIAHEIDKQLFVDEVNAILAAADPPPPVGADWEVTDLLWGSDVEFVSTSDGKHFVMLDVVNRTKANIALLVHQLSPDPSPASPWTVFAAASDVMLPEGGFSDAMAWDVEATEEYALVPWGQYGSTADEGGVALFDLTGLGTPGGPVQRSATQILTLAPYRNCRGAVVDKNTQSRVFLTLGDHQLGNRGGVAVHAFDPDPASPTFGIGALLDSLHEDPDPFLDDFPTFEFTRGARGSWYATYNGVDRFLCVDHGGNLLRFHFDSATNALTLNDVWHNKDDYTGTDGEGFNAEMQDCRRYDFGERFHVLVSQNAETWALVDPGE